MTNYLLIIISTVFVNNIVMVKILGVCPFMGVSRKLEVAVGMGAATIFVLTLASGAGYLIHQYLLGPDLAYLTTLSFIVVIAGIVQGDGATVGPKRRGPVGEDAAARAAEPRGRRGRGYAAHPEGPGTDRRGKRC